MISCSSEQKTTAPAVEADPYEEAERLGLKTTFDDLRYRDIAPEDDAAPLYASYEPTYSDETLGAIRDFVSKNENRKEIERLVNSVDFSQIELITSRPHFKMTGDWDRMVEWLLPQFMHAKYMAVMLCARAVVRAQNDDIDGCVDDIARVAALIGHLDQQGWAIAALVRHTLVSYLAKSVTKIARTLMSRPDDLTQIASALDEIQEPEDMDSFRYEIAFALSGVGMVERGDVSIRQLAGYSSASDEPIDEFEMQLYKNNSEDIRKIIVREYVVFAKAWDDLDELKRLSDSFEDDFELSSGPIDSAAHVFLEITLFNYHQMRTSELTQQAVVRGMKIGIAATILRARTGERATLKEAAKAAGVSSKDPFGGELQFRNYTLPFIYTVRDDGDQGGNGRERPLEPYDVVCFGRTS